MASPQVGDGFTRIANELYDAINRADLSKRQAKVVHAVLRLTYGWNEKAGDLDTAEIAAMTGLHRPHVQAAIKELIDAGILMKTDGAIGIQKDYMLWKITTKMVAESYQNGSRKTTKTVARKTTKTVAPNYQNGSQKATETVAETDAQPSNSANRQAPKDMKDNVVVLDHGENNYTASEATSGQPAPHLLGFDRLVATYARVSGARGFDLPFYKRQALRDFVEEVAMPCGEVQAAIEKWEAETIARTGKPKRVGSPDYFRFIKDGEPAWSDPVASPQAAAQSEKDAFLDSMSQYFHN